VLIPEALNCRLFVASSADQILMGVVQFVLIQFQLRMDETKLLLKVVLCFCVRLSYLLIQLCNVVLTGRDSRFCRLQTLGDLSRFKRQRCRILRGVLHRCCERCVHGVIRQP
jgi:hypothetical protein